MSALSHVAARRAAICLALVVAAALTLVGPASAATPGAATTTTGAYSASSSTTAPTTTTRPTAPTELTGTPDEGERESMGVTSTEVGPAQGGESAQAVPFIGTHAVWCTQSNPSPGICSGHHSYPAIDLGMPVGTPVYAAGPGIVHEVRNTSADERGHYVAIRHPDGIYSRYLHLSSISVSVGDVVATGTMIGRSGNTGSTSSPHLHYDEQRPYGTPKDLGVMIGLSDTATVTYPDAFGYESWTSVPFDTPLRNDGYAPAIPVTPHQWGGPSVTTGDFNGDGMDDVAAGVPGKDSGDAIDAGAVTVLYGTPSGPATAASQQLVPGTNDLAGAAETGDAFGAALAAGDLDGDGFDDLVVGVPREDRGTTIDGGAIIVISGSASGLDAARSRQRWSGTGGNLAGAVESGDQLGAALVAADFNADGIDDLAIGAPGEDVGDVFDAGAVLIAPGSVNGPTGGGTIELASGTAELAGTAQPGDLLGASVGAGDLNADNFADLAIGCPGQDVGSATNAGQVIVLAGSAQGLDPSASRQIRPGIGEVAGRSERDDVFGAAVAVGDVRGDGSQDLVVGAPGEDAAAVNDGAVTVIPGSPTGLDAPRSRQYWSGAGGSAGTPHDNDLLGTALAMGDVDGDGQSEILVGEPGDDVGRATDAGSVLVIGTIHDELTSDSAGVAGASETGDRLGRSVAVGDLNADGYADLVAAAPTEGADGIPTTGALTTMLGSEGAGLTGVGSHHFVRGQAGLAGVARKGDQFGGLLPPYLF